MPWSFRYADEVGQDFRVAVRRMQRRPALTAGIILTIALGLGAATAIFRTFEAALIEPLPYAEPDRLVFIEEGRLGTSERGPTSYSTLLDWRSRARSFTAFEGYDPANFTVGVGDDARMLRGAQLTSGFFRFLGVRLAAGRDFLTGEDEARTGAALVSERLARTMAGGALNRSISVNGSPRVIVGVVPDEFQFAHLQDADVFLPLDVGSAERSDRTMRRIHVMGRLRAGVPPSTGGAELAGVMADLAARFPETMGGRTVITSPLRDALLGSTKPVLTSLLVAVALLLVIMTVNLALLMFTRYVERAPELSMRSTLGATRGRVLRQLLVESLAPSLLGAMLAVGIGQGTARGIINTIPDRVRIDMPYLVNAGLDGTTIAVIAGLAALLSIAFGVGPALVITKTRGRDGDARTTRSRADRRLRRRLVAAQMAVTVVLLVSSGLLIASFTNLLHRDLGLRDPGTLVVVSAPLSGPRYREDGVQQQFYETLIARSAAVPGVQGASAINEVPGGGGGNTTFSPVDRPRPRAQQPGATLRIVAGDYFTTMGIRVVEGRALDTRDRADAPHAAVVSSSFARVLAQDGATVGRRLRLSRTDDAEWEVVGVVNDVQVAALDLDSPPVIYLPHLQAQENRMTLVLRTTLPASTIARQVRSIVKDMDASIPVYAVSSLAQQMTESRAVFTRQLPMILCGVFAAASLALTLIALYATCMHEVESRWREFGIRLALGSAPAALRRLIISDALLVGTAGIVMGAAIAIAVTRSMQAVLFGIAAADWRIYGMVATAVLGFATLATLVPAIRAGSVNPALVMRAE